MEYSALTNKVLWLDLRKNMYLPHHNHSSRFWAALKIGTPSRTCSSQSTSTSTTEPVVVSDDSATVNDRVEPSNSNNIAANEVLQHGGHKWGVLPNENPNLSPAALITLISCIPYQKQTSICFCPKSRCFCHAAITISISIHGPSIATHKLTFTTAWNERFTSSGTFLPRCSHSPEDQAVYHRRWVCWTWLSVASEKTHASI